MTYNKSYTASPNSERETPDKLFLPLNKEFRFSIDAAATASNTKCLLYLDSDDDALSASWVTEKFRGPIWLNPPYSRGIIGQFIKTARATAATENETVVCLLPADPSTEWWRHHVLGEINKQHKVHTEIRFLTPRIKFLLNKKPMKGGSMTPNVIVIFRGQAGNTGRTVRFWNWIDDIYY